MSSAYCCCRADLRELVTTAHEHRRNRGEACTRYAVAKLTGLVVAPAIRVTGRDQCARMVAAGSDLRKHEIGLHTHRNGPVRAVVRNAVAQLAENVVAPAERASTGDRTRVIVASRKRRCARNRLHGRVAIVTRTIAELAQIIRTPADNRA